MSTSITDRHVLNTDTLFGHKDTRTRRNFTSVKNAFSPVPLVSVFNPMYLMTKWVGGGGGCGGGEADGKIFDSRSWRTDHAQQGPCTMTESQLFFYLA